MGKDKKNKTLYQQTKQSTEPASYITETLKLSHREFKITVINIINALRER